MSKKPQIIERNGKPEYAVLPYKNYLSIMERLEDLEDLKVVREFEADKNQEMFPSELVDRLIDGENRLKVWREYRGLKQGELAEQCGVTASYISQLESDKRDGTAKVLLKIAEVLDVDLDQLVSA